MLKTPMSKFCSDLSVRLRDIAEKQVPAKLKPIVGRTHTHTLESGGRACTGAG